MNAENLLQSKLNKVKSFIDNESFVFTFSKTNAFAIHKDQLFKNQIYKTYIDHNGYEINERKNNPFIKNEKITHKISPYSLAKKTFPYRYFCLNNLPTYIVPKISCRSDITRFQ